MRDGNWGGSARLWRGRDRGGDDVAVAARASVGLMALAVGVAEVAGTGGTGIGWGGGDWGGRDRGGNDVAVGVRASVGVVAAVVGGDWGGGGRDQGGDDVVVAALRASVGVVAATGVGALWRQGLGEGDVAVATRLQLQLEREGDMEVGRAKAVPQRFR
ncbi:hypothetical protein EDB89DRAFT_1905041 [Lactarius sanguifluus]|nr:hypothetical protein EDB89DRAFT_1905041 [Lactarius sanguifluus]